MLLNGIKLTPKQSVSFDVKDGVVRYLGGMFFVGGDRHTLLSSLNVLVDFRYTMRGRVIGNIFDNPELMEGGAV